MMPDEASGWILRATLIVATTLVALTVVLVLARSRWPNLAVRSITSALLLLAFPLSALAVDALVQTQVDAWEAKVGSFMCVIPGYVVWIPAALSALAGVVAFRASRRFGVQGAAT